MARTVATHSLLTVNRPVALVYSRAFDCRKAAARCERALKGWTREKKEALVRGDYVPRFEAFE